MIDKYLQRYAFQQAKVDPKPKEGLGLSVVVPVHNETILLESLSSLVQCQMPICDVEVIVVINASEKDNKETKQQNTTTYESAKEWVKENRVSGMDFHFILENELPAKHAGVGLARKIGMDEAAARLFSVGRPDAAIACFDADSKCSENYLLCIYEHFQKNKETSACSIYFEHPLSGSEFSKETYEAIKLYELHLRYYRQALLYAKAPFAYHTIGSSMAVRAEDYCKQGGMNKRKAGEDFYFLQKFIELGNFSEINSTKLIPSPRASERVPFGTGRAVLQHIKGTKNAGMTYHPKSFKLLKAFFEQLENFYENPNSLVSEEIIEFLADKQVFIDKLQEIKKQSSDFASFSKRFYRWFNAFKCLKFIHFVRERLGEVQLMEAVAELEEMMEKKVNVEEDILLRYRNYDSV